MNQDLPEASICISCRRPKAQNECGICAEPVCRACAIYLEQGTFAFLPEVPGIPDELKHSYYCAPCHGQTVAPALASYEATLALAKEVFFFFDSRKQAVPLLIKQSRDVIEVPSCTDRDETILRLGFMAATLGFNAIVNAEVKNEKVRDHAYQKTNWRGKGWPALVDGERLAARLDQEEW